MKINPRGPLVSSHVALLLQGTLEDWNPTFPGPLLYYPNRRHPPPVLAVFVAFVQKWHR